MADDDARARRARFLKELAARDLYAWFGIPPDADDDAIRAAAEAKRSQLAHTPMPQHNRSIERAYCDQGEKALLRPAVRREYDALLAARIAPAAGPRTSAERGVAEREERLRIARERVEHHTADDARMAPGDAMFLGSEDVEVELAGERRAAAKRTDFAETLAEARAARVQGAPLRALALAEKAKSLRTTAGSLNTLGGARRDVGDLAGSETALRESVAMLPSVRENAPGWIALSATLRARGDLDGAEQAAMKVIEEDEDDPHGWHALAFVLTDRGETIRAGDAWERMAKLGLDVPGVLAGLQVLRKDSLARNDQLGAANIDDRIARIRRG
ncbi:tetratricopeptide repeat protein [Miltoncostaea oceani]|uniref:tetratricopeptide repeat protein n=1 Tax=Miltoncostaea oceani TaxID=2843216 RepID=UPI001C3E10F8|nr:tetratricopeptide repeat protein [Miltoncostaea oceani]